MPKSERMTQIEAMLADDPKDAMLRYMLGMEHISANDDATAVTVFEELLRIGTYVPAYHMAGQALNRLGRVSEACKMLKDGIAVARAQSDFHALGEMEGLLSAIE